MTHYSFNDEVAVAGFVSRNVTPLPFAFHWVWLKRDCKFGATLLINGKRIFSFLF